MTPISDYAKLANMPESVIRRCAERAGLACTATEIRLEPGKKGAEFRRQIQLRRELTRTKRTIATGKVG
jgi:hypothetical protein